MMINSEKFACTNRCRPFEILFLAIFLAAVCHGCTAGGRSGANTDAAALAQTNDRQARLEGDLALLLGYRDEEARRLAQALLAHSDRLAREYQLRSPALWHNFLVNLGIRDRGLCCHWTQDLLQKVESMNLRKYHAVWGVSRHGTWREHSSVIVTTGERAFEDGLVLDPWRKAGRLYWVRVADDSYAWEPHPGDDDAAHIRCR